MTTPIKSRLATLALVATVIAACGDARATDAAQDDLKRDLQLASATTMSLATPSVDSALLSSMETQPQSAPEAQAVVKKGAGPRAVRSPAPTVEAEADIDVAALDETEEVQAESLAPAPEEINEPIAIAPRPQPVIVQTGGAGDYGTGRGGVVIRGGGVHGDNCELHRGGGRGGIIYRGPIYLPRNPTNIGIRGTQTRGGSSVAPRVPASTVQGRATPQRSVRPASARPASAPASSRPTSGRPTRGIGTR